MAYLPRDLSGVSNDELQKFYHQLYADVIKNKETGSNRDVSVEQALQYMALCAQELNKRAAHDNLKQIKDLLKISSQNEKNARTFGERSKSLSRIAIIIAVATLFVTMTASLLNSWALHNWQIEQTEIIKEIRDKK